MQSLTNVPQPACTRRPNVRRGVRRDKSKSPYASPTISDSVPKVCSERGSHETFDSFCKIKEIHDFLCTWLSPYNTSNEHVSTEKARAKANKRWDGEDETASMSEKIADLCRATSQLFVAQEKISRLQLELGYLRLSITENSMTQTSEPEPILLRVFHNKSFCRYDPALGILCSNFAVCKPVRGIGELKTRAELTEATLRNHCGGDSATSFISLTNSIGYLRNYISGQRRSHYSSPRSSAMVAFVNKAKLDYMEIFCATSRSLAEEVGARYWSKYNPDGVSYASKEHFMVYGWIPPQCIEKVVSLADLERTRSWILAAANGDASDVKPREILADLESVENDAVGDLVQNLQQAL